MKKYFLILLLLSVCVCLGCGGPSVVVMVPEGVETRVTIPEDAKEVKIQMQGRVAAASSSVKMETVRKQAEEASKELEGETIGTPPLSVKPLPAPAVVTKTEEAAYYYGEGQTTGRTREYALQKAYEQAVAGLAGTLPPNIHAEDLTNLGVEKMAENAGQTSSGFWTATVKVRIAKNKISALVEAKKAKTKTTEASMEKLAEGISTDGNDYYVQGLGSSQDMQFSLDKARHAAEVRLAEYLSGSANFEGTLVGATVVWRNVKKEGELYKVELLLKAPMALNPKE